MAYKTMNIRSVIEKAEGNELCLPAIQRKYVWKADQIERLFDSLYQGYPIGTFLMWNVPKDQINSYKFYSFLKQYHEEDGNFNDLNIGDPTRQVISVLDGQQRITSLTIALKGSYTIVRYGNEVKKELYFNILAFASSDEEKVYFKLLRKEDALKDKKAAWVKVGDFLNLDWLSFINTHKRDYKLFKELITKHPQSALIQEIRSRGEDENQILIDSVERVIRMLHVDENISYYEVRGNEGLDTVTEIFIRINSGGKVLSKSDLLFSTVVSRWEEGREKIDELLKELKEMEFDLDTDFVMRTCLYLTGSPILFKVGNFNNETVQKIITAFEKEGDTMDIKTAILKVFEYLKYELGLHDKVLKSKNVLIPLVYHVYKGGLLDKSSLTEIQKYIYISLLQGVFGSHGDSLLGQLRSGVLSNNNYKLENKAFDFATVISGITERPKKEAYLITEDTINEWLTKKGYEAFMVLSLAYGELPESYDSYALDYLHPRHFFKKSSFPDGEFDEIKSLIDTVPALMFASARDRELRKDDHPLREYIQTILTIRGINIDAYKALHFLQDNDSLELLQFKGLFERRSERLKNKLSELLITPDALPPSDIDTDEEGDNDPIDPQDTPPADAVENLISQDIPEPVLNPLNRIPEEVERLQKLLDLLKNSNLNFIQSGDYDLITILEAIKTEFPEYCNDGYICKQHCLSGNNGPEWKHKVRGYLDHNKNKENSRISRTVDGKWRLK